MCFCTFQVTGRNSHRGGGKKRGWGTDEDRLFERIATSSFCSADFCTSICVGCADLLETKVRNANTRTIRRNWCLYTWRNRMSRGEIPPSAKSPLSLQADYANPKLYGWASILVGIIAFLVGVPMLFMSVSPPMIAVIVALGAVLVAAGLWMVKRGE